MKESLSHLDELESIVKRELVRYNVVKYLMIKGVVPMVKKWGIILLILSVILVGCSNEPEQDDNDTEEDTQKLDEIAEKENVQETVESFFEAYKDKQFEDAEVYLVDDQMELENFAIRNVYPEKIIEAFHTLMTDFEVELGDITIDRNEAIVMLKITNYDLPDLLNQAIEEVDGELPNSDITADKMVELGEEASKATLMQGMKLVKQEDEWKIMLDNEMKTAITSGLYAKHQTALTEPVEMEEMQDYMLTLIDQMNTLFDSFDDVEEFSIQLENEESVDVDQAFAAIDTMHDQLQEAFADFEETSLLNHDTSDLAYLLKSNFSFMILSIDAYGSLLRELIDQQSSGEELDQELLEQLQISALDIEKYYDDFLNGTNEYLTQFKNSI